METKTVNRESILSAIEAWSNDKESEHAKAFMSAIEFILNGELKVREQLINEISEMLELTIEQKDNPETSIFVNDKINLTFIEHAIFRIDAMMSHFEGMRSFMQLKQTAEQFSDILSKEEFNELAGQYVNRAELTGLLCTKISFMILWQHGIESGKYTRKLGKL